MSIKADIENLDRQDVPANEGWRTIDEWHEECPEHGRDWVRKALARLSKEGLYESKTFRGHHAKYYRKTKKQKNI